MTQAGETIEVHQHTHHDAPKSPRLRGPSLSPLEEAMKSQVAGQELDPGSPGTPPSPSAIPRHQRLYGYERQHDAKNPQERATAKRAQTRNLNAAAMNSAQQATVTSIPTPRSAERRPTQRSICDAQNVPSTAQSKAKQKPTAPSSPAPRSLKNAATAVVASQRFGAGGSAHRRTNSGGRTARSQPSAPSFPAATSFKQAATAVVASQRFSAGGMEHKRTSSGGSGRSTGDSSTAGVVMSQEGELHHAMTCSTLSRSVAVDTCSLPEQLLN